MNATNQRLCEVQKLLVAEYREGYADGINLGFEAADRILTLIKMNPQLKEPRSVEELVGLSEKELTNLRSRLGNIR